MREPLVRSYGVDVVPMSQLDSTSLKEIVAGLWNDAPDLDGQMSDSSFDLLYAARLLAERGLS